MTQIYHHVKFRWTENLTSRFIQLRKENGKLFTGRKYSAQAGWEYILRQMKQEFPTIMADVPFRVLKKKWSNLLQQYKELKNPVHGDKNKADDVSWPFYSAIDEIVLGQDHHKSIMGRLSKVQTIDDIEEEEEEEIDPHEFLCVSVTPTEEQISPPSSSSSSPTTTTIESKFFSQQQQQQDYHKHYDDDTPIQVVEEEFSRSRATSEKFESTPTISVRNLTSLGRSTGNQSRMSHQQQLQIIQTAVNHAKRPRQQVFLNEKNNKMRKMTFTGFQRSRNDNTTTTNDSPKQSQRDVVKKINEFFNYTKQRDEENRLIMLKILTAVEKIANKLD